MEHLPLYIPVLFALTTLSALLLLLKASGYSKRVIILLLVWLAIQAAIGLSGFYVNSTGVPPRFALLLIPPVVFITILFIIPKSRLFIDGLDVKTLTLMHVARVPVELVLYGLFIHHAIPQVMTFEGRNFDILCGLTAPSYITLAT